jgi:hypothetical protein
MKITITATFLFLIAASAYGQAPKPQPQPTLKETLGWIQDSLNSYGDVEKETAKGTETRALRLADFSGCRVHFVLTYTVAGNEAHYRVENSFNLRDIDPENGGFTSLGTSRPGFFRAVTQNAIEKISFKTTSYGPSPPADLAKRFPADTPNRASDGTSALFIVDMYSPYGDDFANAFKHAVKMCGGKPSIFTDSDREDVASRFAPSRKDIPTIAKDADGAVVSIVIGNEDHPIAQGTGFFVSKDGVIVTNYHVIENGDRAIVKLPDGTSFRVDGMLAFDKHRDVALIKAHGENFRTLTLGDSDQLQVGEEIVAIGNPLSLESTVSNGIVSGIRTAEEEGGRFLQVTAPISPGSSGGPLFNMAGEAIGITTMYLKGGENLNFAIPINDVKRLLLNQSAKLQNLPNEPEPEETPEETHTAPPSPPKEIPREPVPGAPADTSITKTGACLPDIPHASQAQFWSDIQCCYRNPSNTLQFSNGVLSCTDAINIIEEEVRDCKSMGKKAPNGESCKTFLKNYERFKEGRLSIQ